MMRTRLIHISLTTLWTLDLSPLGDPGRVRLDPRCACASAPLTGRGPDLTVCTPSPITDPAQERRPGGEVGTARFLGPGDLPQLAILARQPLAGLVDRYARGSWCAIVELDGTIASYCWVSTRSEQIGESECVLTLLRDAAYVWDCATTPAHRGRGLYPALLRHIGRELRRTGYRRLWIAAAWSNRASRRGLEKAGFSHIASIVHVCLGKWRLTVLIPTPTAPPELVTAARQAVASSPAQTEPTTSPPAPPRR